ncbi:MAG: hypothetical protein ACFCGT_22170 [Sandaracinaceae bacterium]
MREGGRRGGATRVPLGLAALLASLLVPAALPACVLELRDGLTVDVEVEGRTERAVSADGVEVLIDEAWVRVASIALVGCDGGPEGARPVPRSPTVRWGPAGARAHHPGDDGRLSERAVAVPLHRTSAPTMLGRLRPPPGDYCALRLTIVPSDEARGPLGDRSLVVTGRRGAEPLLVDGVGQRLVTLPFLDDAGQPAELALDLPGAPPTLRLSWDLGPAFDGQILGDLGPEALGLALMTRLEAGLVLHLPPA